MTRGNANQTQPIFHLNVYGKAACGAPATDGTLAPFPGLKQCPDCKAAADETAEVFLRILRRTD